MLKSIALAGAAALCACGSSSSDFEPAPPPPDPCSLLTLADAQTIVPDALPGEVGDSPPDTADYWSRDCSYNSAADATKSIDLVLFGAKTSDGLAMIRLAAASGQVNTPVSGLGDEAHYWEETSDNGLWTIKGAVSVDVTAYFLNPFPTADQLTPLVAKALDALAP